MEHSVQARLDALTVLMTEYFSGDPKRIQHFIKVHSLAALIGRAEGLPENAQEILEAAAVVHDIGIKPAEALYGSCGGKLQEQLGPPEAEKLLLKAGYSQQATQRACYLVSRHHTYTDIDGADLQILIEADFLVNLYEDACSRDAVESALTKIFATETGKALCRAMFGL